MSEGVKIPLPEARRMAEALCADLAPHCTRIEIAGSIRRMRPMVGDIEIVCIPKEVPVDAGTDIFGNPLPCADKQRDKGFVAVVRRYTATHVKGHAATGRYVQFITRTGVKVDLFMARPENWGYILAIRTGSAEFSQSLAWRWKKLGYEGVDGMLTKYWKDVPLREERDLFDLLGIQWVQPSER